MRHSLKKPYHLINLCFLFVLVGFVIGCNKKEGPKKLEKHNQKSSTNTNKPNIDHEQSLDSLFCPPPPDNLSPSKDSKQESKKSSKKAIIDHKTPEKEGTQNEKPKKNKKFWNNIFKDRKVSSDTSDKDKSDQPLQTISPKVKKAEESKFFRSITKIFKSKDTKKPEQTINSIFTPADSSSEKFKKNKFQPSINNFIPISKLFSKKSEQEYNKFSLSENRAAVEEFTSFSNSATNSGINQGEIFFLKKENDAVSISLDETKGTIFSKNRVHSVSNPVIFSDQGKIKISNNKSILSSTLQGSFKENKIKAKNKITAVLDMLKSSKESKEKRLMPDMNINPSTKKMSFTAYQPEGPEVERSGLFSTEEVILENNGSSVQESKSPEHKEDILKKLRSNVYEFFLKKSKK